VHSGGDSRFTVDSQIECISIISDETDHRIIFDDTGDYTLNYSAVTRHTDSTATSGGRIAQVKNVDPYTIQKSLTFEANDSGHMVSRGRVLDSHADRYSGRAIEAEGNTIFTRSGNLESKVSIPYYEDFFMQSVSSIPGKERPFTLTDAQLNARIYHPSITPLWDFGFITIGFVDAPGNLSQMQEITDKTSLAGNISTFRKAYSTWDYYDWNESYVNGTNESPYFIPYRHFDRCIIT
jgi:hypothetical protein